MKHLIILGLLVTVNGQAQEQQQQEEQKRPSWSQGLPERPSSVNPSATVNDFKIDKQARLTSTDDRSLETSTLPEVEIELENTQPLVDFKLDVEPIKPAAISRREAFEEYYNDEDNETVAESEAVNPLIAEYKWALLKTTPIEVPENSAENTTLKLKIYINSKGHVTRVKEADTNIPNRMFRSAEKSILKWRFQAPSELGITEEISKTFSIDIQSEA